MIRTRLIPAVLVAVVAFVAAWLAVLPGVAFWDTGELQAVGPLMGTAHPTGFPTYVLLGWLASVLLQPFGEPAFRMNIFSAICLAVAAGVTVDLVRALTGWIALGVAAGIAMALTPIAWAIGTHAEAHSLHLALVAILLWLLVAWDARVRVPAVPAGDTGGEPDPPAAAVGPVDPPTTDPLPMPVAAARPGDRYLIAAAFVFALAVGNHSLTLLLAIPVGLYVLAVDPDIWRRSRLVLSCVGVLVLTLVVVYLELPLRAGPFRAALVYGTPDTSEGFKYIVLAEQFQGSLTNPFGDLPGKFAELGRAYLRPVRDPRAAHPDRLRRDRGAPASLRPADRVRRGDHLLLRHVVRQRGHRPLLPRSGADGLDLAGDPGRRRDRRPDRVDRRTRRGGVVRHSRRRPRRARRHGSGSRRSSSRPLSCYRPWSRSPIASQRSTRATRSRPWTGRTTS